MYYDFSEPIRYAKHYRVLAMNRGEKEDVLAVNLSFDKDKIMSFLEEKIIMERKQESHYLKRQY